MPRVQFIYDYDWKPTEQSTIAYKAGWTGLVTTACAKSALSAGKIKRVAKNEDQKQATRSTSGTP